MTEIRQGHLPVVAPTHAALRGMQFLEGEVAHYVIPLGVEDRPSAAAVEYSPQANLYLYSDGLRIERTVGNTILRFKSKSDGTAEIVGELLSALMR